MKEFFEDIFEYHYHFNQKLVDLLINNSQKIDVKIISLFSHTLNAHQIWNSRILNAEPFSVHQIHTLEECKTVDEHNYNNTLDILKGFDLDKTITYHNTKGQEFENSICQILFHVANHHTHHKGQIIFDLRQKEIEPIVTDYIFYKR
ncbi:DinB family protein [Abyssalbus ytuae]|uniref:Damage-inducible protein DinB n=1 Tax=Abyssalbus ytuae TaxID=2926907 RepID=A0A9E6ZKS8_9FLAO|nr:DinB family protein [Abyssalbus ytuae]UOB17567.1 damage-inducible protein DinB [Abyssalbus ytuae]